MGENAFSGHYVTDVKNESGFTRYNDSVATKISEADVYGEKNRSSAYIAMYAFAA